jgi:hypothetical protein
MRLVEQLGDFERLFAAEGRDFSRNAPWALRGVRMADEPKLRGLRA